MPHPKNPFLALRAPLKKLYETAYSLEAQGNLEAASAGYQDMMAQTTEYKEILELISFRLKDPVSVALTVQAATTPQVAFSISMKPSLTVEEDLLFRAILLKYNTLTLPIEKAYLARYLALFFLYEVGDFEKAWHFFQVTLKEEPDVLISSDWEAIAEFYRNNIDHDDVFEKSLTVLKLFFRAAQIAVSEKERTAIYSNMRILVSRAMWGGLFKVDERTSARMKEAERLWCVDFSAFIRGVSDEEKIENERALLILEGYLGESRYWTLLLSYFYLESKQYEDALDFFMRLFEQGLPDCCKEDGVREAYRESLKIYFLKLASAKSDIKDMRDRFSYLTSLTEMAFDMENFATVRALLWQVENLWITSPLDLSVEARERYIYLKNRAIQSSPEIILSALMEMRKDNWAARLGAVDDVLIKNINTLSISEKNTLYEAIIQKEEFFQDNPYLMLYRADWAILLWQPLKEIESQRAKEPTIREFVFTPMMLAASVGYISYALHLIRNKNAQNLLIKKGRRSMNALELAAGYHQAYFLQTVLLYVNVCDQIIRKGLAAVLSKVEKNFQIAGLLFHVLRQFRDADEKRNSDMEAVYSDEILRFLISRGLDGRDIESFRRLLSSSGYSNTPSVPTKTLLERVNQWIFLVDLKQKIGAVILDEVLCLRREDDESQLQERMSATQCLINAGVDLNAELAGKTVLESKVTMLLTIMGNNQNCVKLFYFLIKQGAKLSPNSVKDNLIVLQAVRMNDLALAKYFLGQGVSANATNQYVEHEKQPCALSQVFFSVFNHGCFGYDKAFPVLMSWYRLLLSQGANPDVKDIYGDTVIHATLKSINISAKSKLAIVKLFLKHRASLNIPDAKNLYPLTTWVGLLAVQYNHLEVNSVEYHLFSLLFEKSAPRILGEVVAIIHNQEIPFSLWRWLFEEKNIRITQVRMQRVMLLGERSDLSSYFKGLQRMCYFLPHYLNTLQDNKLEEEKKMKDWIKEKLPLFFSMVESNIESFDEKRLTGIHELLTVYLDRSLLSTEAARKKEEMVMLCQRQREILRLKREAICAKWVRYLSLPEKEVTDEKVLEVRREWEQSSDRWIEEHGVSWCWVVKNENRLKRRSEMMAAYEKPEIIAFLEKAFLYLQNIEDKSFKEEEAKRLNGLIKIKRETIQKEKQKQISFLGDQSSKFREWTKCLVVEERRSSLVRQKEMLEIFEGRLSQSPHFEWARRWLPLFLLEMIESARRERMQDEALFSLDLLEAKDDRSAIGTLIFFKAFDAFKKVDVHGYQERPASRITYFFEPPPTQDNEAAVASELAPANAALLLSPPGPSLRST